MVLGPARWRLPSPRSLWWGLLPVVWGMACRNDAEDVLVEFPPPRLAALAPSEEPLELQLGIPSDEPSRIEVQLKGKRLEEQVLYESVDGTVELNPNDLHQLQGEIRVLLRDPRFEGDPPAVSPRLLSRALGLFTDASSGLGTRLVSPYAVFRIRQVVESSARALRLLPRRTEAGHARSVVRLRVRGELELMGTRSEQTLGVTIAALANPETPDVYERFEVDCSSPMNLSLKRYGIELWSAHTPTADEPPVRFTSARLGCRLVATPR